ncbi:unnamed protein product [Effrenium voratum]|uniref:Uncharacterized protein n=1 Tax=Effrenium voratum TaxID=2562239 RepID=A0AA36N0W2_9DINO|nr:unnamed protein product [Effrenium voratum]
MSCRCSWSSLTISDLGQPGIVRQVKKLSLPRRLAAEDPSLPHGTFLPEPRRCYSQGALLPPSRSTTTPCSSSRSPEEANWDDTLAAVQRSARSTTSEPRWEPQLGSPVLPRPVLSRPLRRPSSATSLGLERLVEEAETALREVPVRRQERRPQPRRRHPFSDLLEMLPQETRMRPLSDIFDRLERPKLQSKQQERLREQPELKPDPKAKLEAEARRPKPSGWVPMTPASEGESKLSVSSQWLELEGEQLAEGGEDGTTLRAVLDSSLGQEVQESEAKCLLAEAQEPTRLKDRGNKMPRNQEVTLSGLLQSMEEDEHLSRLARIGPVHPPTLEETLQDMALAVANADSALLASHPPSQLEASAQLKSAAAAISQAPRKESKEKLDQEKQENQERSPEQEEPRAVPLATPRSAEIASELLRKKSVKSPLLSDLDAASVLSYRKDADVASVLSYRKEVEETGLTPEALARFLTKSVAVQQVPRAQAQQARPGQSQRCQRPWRAAALESLQRTVPRLMSASLAAPRHARPRAGTAPGLYQARFLDDLSPFLMRLWTARFAGERGLVKTAPASAMSAANA